MAAYHPHDPLTASEISLASACFRTEMLKRGVKSLKSCAISLLERASSFPSTTSPTRRALELTSFSFPLLLHLALKNEVIAFLGLPVSPTDFKPFKSGVRPARRAEAHLIDCLTGDVFVAVCTFPLGGGKPSLDSVDQQPKGVQPAITMEELDESEQVVRNDPEVIRLCAEVGVSADQIMVDAWSIGYEHRFGDVRLQQGFVYQRLGPHEHLYAHPLDCASRSAPLSSPTRARLTLSSSCTLAVNVVIDTNAKKILKIGTFKLLEPPHGHRPRLTSLLAHADFAPHRTDPSKPAVLSGSTAPHTVEGNSYRDSGRPRIPPQQQRMDYLPDLIKAEKAKNGEDWDVRRDLKELTITQPDGVSFQMNGNEISCVHLPSPSLEPLFLERS